LEIDAVLGKNEKRNYFYAAFTIRKAREEAVGDRLIALVFNMFWRLLYELSILYTSCLVLALNDSVDIKLPDYLYKMDLTV